VLRIVSNAADIFSRLRIAAIKSTNKTTRAHIDTRTQSGDLALTAKSRYGGDEIAHLKFSISTEKLSGEEVKPVFNMHACVSARTDRKYAAAILSRGFSSRSNFSRREFTFLLNCNSICNSSLAIQPFVISSRYVRILWQVIL